jgi:hypothetical protein
MDFSVESTCLIVDRAVAKSLMAACGGREVREKRVL